MIDEDGNEWIPSTQVIIRFAINFRGQMVHGDQPFVLKLVLYQNWSKSYTDPLTF